MTKTRATLHKKSVTQKEAAMEIIPITSMSEMPVSSNSVKLEHVADIARVTGARVEQLATDSLQSHINTFSSLRTLHCVSGHHRHCCTNDSTVVTVPEFSLSIDYSCFLVVLDLFF